MPYSATSGYSARYQVPSNSASPGIAGRCKLGLDRAQWTTFHAGASRLKRFRIWSNRRRWRVCRRRRNSLANSAAASFAGVLAEDRVPKTSRSPSPKPSARAHLWQHSWADPTEQVATAQENQRLAKTKMAGRCREYQKRSAQRYLDYGDSFLSLLFRPRRGIAMCRRAVSGGKVGFSLGPHYRTAKGPRAPPTATLPPDFEKVVSPSPGARFPGPQSVLAPALFGRAAPPDGIVLDAVDRSFRSIAHARYRARSEVLRARLLEPRCVEPSR